MNSKSFSEQNLTIINHDQHNKPFAEIIESCLDNVTAQCWQWDNFPTFGSLVQVDTQEQIIFGCVTNIQTGSLDALRYPFPYQKTEDELRREQPQIFEFLKTTFKVQILGYIDKKNSSRVLYLIPPKPCKIHAFISSSSLETQQLFFQKFDFLNLVFAFAHQIPSIDELLLVIIQNLSQKNMLSQEKLDQFCQKFSLLTGNDYRRLKLFFQRIEASITYK